VGVHCTCDRKSWLKPTPIVAHYIENITTKFPDDYRRENSPICVSQQLFEVVSKLVELLVVLVASQMTEIEDENLAIPNKLIHILDLSSA
jgi:hypothetical protein